MAGNIGIQSVSSLAAQVEQAVRQKDDSVGDLLDQLDRLLEEQTRQIADVLKATGSPKSAPAAFDPEAAKDAAAALETLLLESDPGVEEECHRLAQALGGVVAQSQFDELNEAVRNFDFEEAREKLAAVLAAIPESAA